MEPSITPPPTPTQPVPATPPGISGRPPSRSSALRAGMVLGTALVVLVGAALAMGASPAPSSTGAGPQAAASGSGKPDKEPHGNGFGHGGFGGFGPGGPSAGGFGPFAGGDKPGKGLGRPFNRVTITAIDGSNLALTTDDGWTRTIAITSTTTITRGGAAATKADLHVGDAIRFRQQKNADGSFTITAVDVVLPEVFGAVKSVSGSTLTITDRDGATITVHLGSGTAIRVRGVDAATAKDLAAGQLVIVVGEKRSDGSIDATTVASGKFRGPGGWKPKADHPDESEAPEASDQPG